MKDEIFELIDLDILLEFEIYIMHDKTIWIGYHILIVVKLLVFYVQMDVSGWISQFVVLESKLN